MRTIDELVKEYATVRSDIKRLETVKGNLSRDIKAYMMAKGIKETEIGEFLVTYEPPTVREKIEFEAILRAHDISLETIKADFISYIHVKDSVNIVESK